MVSFYDFRHSSRNMTEPELDQYHIFQLYDTVYFTEAKGSDLEADQRILLATELSIFVR